MLIIVFASVFSHAIALVGGPRALFGTLGGWQLPAWQAFVVIFVALLVIADALEELSVMIRVLPILFSLVTGFGFDPVWFGIVMVIWLQIGFITLPVGINLFIIHRLSRGTTIGGPHRWHDPVRPGDDRVCRNPVPVSGGRALAPEARDGAAVRRLRLVR